MTRYYFAFETGNDANSGLTTALPKRSPSAATALILAGNQISFRMGEKWKFSAASTGWSIAFKQLATLCTIDTYDSAFSDRKPCFDALTYLVAGVDDANWTSLGDGRWTRNFSGEVSRMFSNTTENGIRAGTIGTPFGYVTSAAAVTSTSKWFMLTASPWTVTMYTGSNTVAPPTFFNNLACSGNGICTAEVIKLSRCKNVTLNGLQVWGGQRQGFSLIDISTPPNSDISLIDCESHATGRQGNAFQFSNVANLGVSIDRITVTRPLADAHSTEAENDSDTGRWSSNNGIGISGAVENLTITDPIIRGGFRHSCLQAQTEVTATESNVPKNIVVQKSATETPSYIDCAGSNYAHGVDTDADGWLVEGIEVRNQITRSQIGGTGTLRRCYYYGLRLETHPGGSDRDQAIIVQNWVSSGSYRKVQSVTIDGCIFDNCFDHTIRLYEDRTAAGTSPEAGWATNAVTMKNCTFVDLNNVGTRTYTITHEVAGTPFVNSGLFLTNNIFVTTIAQPLRRETAAGVYTSYDVNEYSQASGNTKYATVSAAGLDPVTFLPLVFGRGGINDTAKAALSAGKAVVVAFVEMQLTSTLRFNTSAVSIDWNGNTWVGAGALGSIEEVSESPSEQRSLRFALSGVPSSLLSVALQEAIRNKPCSLYLGVLDADTHAVLQAPRIWAGTLDQMPIEQNGETCTISVTAEHAGATFARPKPLRYIDADQKRLYPGDTSLRFVSSQANHQDVWPSSGYFKR